MLIIVLLLFDNTSFLFSLLSESVTFSRVSYKWFCILRYYPLFLNQLQLHSKKSNKAWYEYERHNVVMTVQRFSLFQ
jgi:hypothetical protein